jgi:integrase
MPYDDLWAVLDWCDAHGHHDMRRAVALGAYAGLRVSEVAELEWGDVEWFGARARARIVGKGGKPRIVDLSPALVDMLGPDRGGNVVTGESVAWDGARLQRRVNRLIRAAGVKRATFHSLRHRYGTMAYQASGDLVAVGGQMGHASITTTAIYAAAASDAGAKLADAVAAANAPRVEPLRAARVTHVTAVPLASN